VNAPLPVRLIDSKDGKRQFQRRLLRWYDRHKRDLPWRRERDLYPIWVSEIMLQQTRVNAVLEYYGRFLKRFPKIEDLARAREASVLAAWSGLGYYRRARMLHAAAKKVVKEHEGKFPSTATGLRTLPGIGRYTAGAICSIAFNQPTPILDGNVIRVLTRLFGISGDPRERMVNQRLWALSEQFVLAAARLLADPGAAAAAGYHLP